MNKIFNLTNFHKSFIKNRRMSFNTAKIGVIQLCSTSNKSSNFLISSKLIKEAADSGAEMVFLPEAYDYIGSSRAETLSLSETINGESISKFCEIARCSNIWISLGGMHRKTTEEIPSKIFNSHIIINSNGDIVALYDKVHLFDVNIESPNAAESVNLQESKYVNHGTFAPIVTYNTPVGNLGLAICYDLRFSEMANALRYACQSDVIAYPSAFTVATGNAGHWHTLLKARAIETQTYIIAAALEGDSNINRSFFGHSIVVDPWGQIIAEKTNPGPGLLLCNINGWTDNPIGPGMSIKKARNSIPVSLNRRFDLFPCPDNGRPIDIGTKNYVFSPNIVIHPDVVFYRTQLSYAFVNISPLLPGHILVSPIRGASRFEEMTHGEVTDLYSTVKALVPKLSKQFCATSMTIAIQDGEDAGQSVPHVHVHILPRKAGDFQFNDDIYQNLQNHDKVIRKKRSQEEMVVEATILRGLFY